MRRLSQTDFGVALDDAFGERVLPPLLLRAAILLRERRFPDGNRFLEHAALSAVAGLCVLGLWRTWPLWHATEGEGGPLARHWRVLGDRDASGWHGVAAAACVAASVRAVAGGRIGVGRSNPPVPGEGEPELPRIDASKLRITPAPEE